MKFSKNNKGAMSAAMWGVIIGFIICAILAGGVYFRMIKIQSQLGGDVLTQFGQAGGNASNSFLFQPKTLSIVITNNNCIPSTADTPDKSQRFSCKPGDISFESSIYNGGPVGGDNSQKRFYGGFAVCELTCKKGLLGQVSCDNEDKTCITRIISASGTCTIKSGETKTCDAGLYTFTEGEYEVVPIATCYMDETYGCTEIGMTGPVTQSNVKAYLRLTIAK